jgi:hypothetical protein
LYSTATNSSESGGERAEVDPIIQTTIRDS